MILIIQWELFLMAEQENQNPATTVTSSHTKSPINRVIASCYRIPVSPIANLMLVFFLQIQVGPPALQQQLLRRRRLPLSAITAALSRLPYLQAQSINFCAASRF